MIYGVYKPWMNSLVKEISLFHQNLIKVQGLLQKSALKSAQKLVFLHPYGPKLRGRLSGTLREVYQKSMPLVFAQRGCKKRAFGQTLGQTFSKDLGFPAKL